jgi:hypothetical protein
MSAFHDNVLIGASAPTGYNLTRSLRFRSSASAYLNRTPASAGNRKTWTWSGWVKRGTFGGYQNIFAGGATASDTGTTGIFFNPTDGLTVGGSTTNWLITSQVFRDPSAWYHIIVVMDSTNATANNRLRIYVNGSEVTAFGTRNNLTLNTDYGINQAALHCISFQSASIGTSYLDGYQTEINFIDGQALTPSSFGETSATTGVWQPKRYTGTYGTNGFYLPFTDNSTAAALGTDFSGNSNTWTTNNISITAGATYDSMTDVPTLTSATTSNFSVMNPLTTGSFTTLSAGNLNTLGNTSSNNGNSRSTFAMTTGKWYFEVTLTANNVSIYPQIGIMTARDGSRPNNGYPQAGYPNSSLDPNQSVIYMADGTKQTNGSVTSYGSSFTNGDIIGVAIDSDNGAIYFSKNGTFQNSGVPTSGASKTGAALTWTGGTVEHVVSISDYNGTATAVNFGQRPFSYTPPTGFVALNTFNLPTPTIGASASTLANKYMNQVLYTGTGSARSVTGTGFQPDWLWIKKRSAAENHALYDVIRGAGKRIESSTTSAEDAESGGISSFDSDGFSISGGNDRVNTNGATYVAWQWRANGAAVTNTAGSITSQVSANTSAGFSVVTFTMPSSGVSTIGHGLGVAPSMVILKSRANSSGWVVYHFSTGNSGYTLLNTTSAFASDANAFNNTSPTSSVFTVGTSFNGLAGTYVMYAFAEVAGYSKFGSYTGNGSADGTFVYTGFKPRWVMIKASSATGSWCLFDAARNTYNEVNELLNAEISDAEFVDVGGLDFLSNGFKQRNTNTNRNNSGTTYIYMAFAENPFKYSLAR